MRKIILRLFFKADWSSFFKASVNILHKLYVHHKRHLQSGNFPFERHLNIDFLGNLSTTKLLKFNICKNEKPIASNLENVKKRKKYSFDFHKKFANETIFKEILFYLVKKMLQYGQVTIRYKIRSHAIWQWALIITLERSMFLVWKPEILHLKHWYLPRHWSCCYIYCPY